MEEFNDVIGSLGEEIEEQNLENIDGGSSQICASIKISGMITAGLTWVNEKATAKYNCGGVATVTVECLCG